MIFKIPSVLEKNNVTLTVLENQFENLLTDLASEKIIWERAKEPYYKPEVFKEKWLDKAIKQMEEGQRVCFVISWNHKIIGSSSYYEMDLSNKKINIGYTWFHPSVWGTKVNALSKYMMLEYAFETLKLNRVAFSVDSCNKRSCRSLEKLGITCEGTLRNHMVLPDRLRHTVIFSVIHDEWPQMKNNLKDIIERGIN